MIALSAGSAQQAYRSFDRSIYRLAPGDAIRLRVFDQEPISGEYAVATDGAVSVPLVGRVRVKGLSVNQVESRIRGRLTSSGVIVEPRLSVEVARYRPYYVHGEVGASGQFPFVAGLTIEKAIAAAGGFTKFASMRRFKVVREERGELVTLSLTSLDMVKPGDTITVSERFL